MTEDIIGQIMIKHFHTQTQAIEAYCEMMLVSPIPVGVLVEWWLDGSYRVSLSKKVAPMSVTYQEHDTYPPSEGLGSTRFGE